MKYFYAMLLFSLVTSLLGWNLLGPSDYSINDYLCAETEVLCTNSGLLIYDWQENEWNEYSNGGLPVWQAIRHIDNQIIVVMGNGSYSDGVWLFDLETKQFSIIEWMYMPNFIFKTNSGYYVGLQNSLIYSENLLNWVSIAYFDDYNCVDMEMFDGNLVVSTGDIVFRSTDNGGIWYSPSTSPLITDIAFDQSGKLWGIFPSCSNSSGLYSSVDLGETWDVEMWDMGLSSVYWVGGQIYIAWEEFLGGGSGVARWNATTHTPDFLDEIQADISVNKLTTNDMIDCYNLVATTDQGAYVEFDLEVSVDEEEIIPVINFSNYPNPFSEQTTFILNSNEREIGEYSYQIYNIKGELVETIDSNNQSVWNSKNRPSGIYLVKLMKDGKKISHQKITLLK